jgi:hypothetical protein
MVDFGRYLGSASDGEKFVDGFFFVIAFVAHVRDVDALVLGGDLGEGDELVCFESLFRLGRESGLFRRGWERGWRGQGRKRAEWRRR